MKVTPTTAREVLAALARHETPGRAAHDCRITLESIRPYTDRATSRTLAVLEMLQRNTPERRAELRAKLADIAATAPEVTP